MKTNFDTIFPEIRDKLDITSKIGFDSDAFIRNDLTMLVTVKCLGIKYAMTYRGPEDFFENASNKTFKTIENTLAKWCAEHIWRINQKRVAHGLESWF